MSARSILTLLWIRAVLWMPTQVVDGLVRCNLYELSDDLRRCIETVDSCSQLPEQFIVTLMAAEDHRNALHPGVDPIAVVRAAIVWLLWRRLQGASTVEQQLVRVVLGRYERTFLRKLREQALAIALGRIRPKDAIASAYLAVAFYGSGLYGDKALRSVCGDDLRLAPQESISYVMAWLKYPRPQRPSMEWEIRVQRRAQYISSRIGLVVLPMKRTKPVALEPQ